MKTSNKSSIITGVVLLLLAALFSISLILQPLDFGYGGPGHNNFFFLIGNIIFTVYGFSSILIPVFLLVAGLSCFATTWTARKTMYLLTAIVPFFTAVITENICRSILALGKGPFTVVKLIIAIATGILLIVMEFLGSGIIADKLNERLFYKNTKRPAAPKPVNTQSNKASDGESGQVDFVKMKSIKAPAIFDAALKEAVSDEEMKISEEELQKQEVELGLREIPLEQMAEEEKEEECANPASIISQEEYAALTKMDDYPEEENQAEELEWPDLPPAPKTLPPEYDDAYDENDPALEFPPKDEEFEEEAVAEEEVQREEKAVEEESSVIQEENSVGEESSVIQEENSVGEEQSEHNSDFENIDDDIIDDEVIVEETFPFSEDDFEEDEKTTLQKEEALEEEKNPYSATKYIDKVVENPKYPHGISLFDDDEEVKNEEKKEEVKKPKFPAKINLMQEQEEEEEVPSVENIVSFANETGYEPGEIAKPAGLTAAASNVFSSMEEDIRKSAGKMEVTQKEASFEDSIFDTQEDTEEDAGMSLAPNTRVESSANNLTADELTDFFNAQQEENTPKTTVIPSKPKQEGHRVTKKGPYVIPSDLLIAYKDDQYWLIDDATKQASLNLKQTLAEFNIEAEIIGIKKGPVVTMFEILPAPGVKLSKIVALQDNIALSLAAQSVRIVAPIPGKQAVGIEVPNKHRSVVGFREIIEMDLPDWKKMAVPVILGKDILGKAQLIDLAKTPHMLIAGATGSGKSVCVNSLILSILYKRSPEEVKMILVDPKVVELKLYNNIPHLLVPVITEPKKALQSLQWCLCEMERRYALLDSMGVRDISNYNQKIKDQKICTEKLPYIVVIIDEFADLMATSGKELETVIARLTAMSRAVGIHLVLATQRPSVNVITGLIKANIPTRIAFMVASRTDSNIIIDTVGAEKLLGRGDMLYASAADPAPIRIQGTFVTDQEVEDVVKSVKEYGEPDYIDEEIFVESDEERALDLFGQPMDDDDPLYDQALEIVVQSGKASASYLQRRLSIGYNRAARLVEEMEERGIVGPANGSKPREIIHIPS